MRPDPFDAVVIGAGPAGSLAACLLGREGLRVLLVERRPFPRRKVCGGCLNARALASLERAGLAPRVRALGAADVRVLRVKLRDRSAAITLPPGLAVSRHALDGVLASAAVEAGCQLRTETTAAVEPHGDPSDGEAWRQVRLTRIGEGPVTVRARAVVVADGLGHSSLRDCPPFESRVAPASRVGIGGDASHGSVGIEPASIVMAVSRHGYAGAVAVEGGRVNIAAAVDPAFLKNSGGPAGAIGAIFSDAGVRANVPLDSIEWMGTPPLTRRLVPPAAPGLFVVGDAAGYVEPFTGEGMAWAFAGAEAVVPFVRRAVRAPGVALDREWTRALASAIGPDQRWCRLLASGLRQPLLVRLGVALLGRHPELAAPLLARFSPRLDPAPERSA